jgi:hypothetical protein
MTIPPHPIAAITQLAHAIDALKATGVIRSRRFTGDLGEWYVAQLYSGTMADSQVEKGWDVRLTDGTRLQVKTQSYDLQNRWNYLDSDPAHFDRLVVVILNDNFTLRNLYDIPVADLTPLLRTGREGRPQYFWDTLAPWQVAPQTLPGAPPLSDLITALL